MGRCSQLDAQILGVTVQENDINIIHHLPSRTPNKLVIVRFNNRQIRNRILYATKNTLNAAECPFKGVYIQEDLTVQRSKMFRYLKGYWFTLFNQFPYDIAFCLVYVAPEGSKYSNIQCFETLETDILNFTSNNYKICLLGDFDAHTSNDHDFTYVDDSILQSFDIGYVTEDNLGICPLAQLKFSKERHNSDLSHTNNYGKRLLELCKACDLYIGNGRLGRDKLLGCKTCKGVTVVDYCDLVAIFVTKCFRI